VAVETVVAESLPGAVALLTGGSVIATCPGCGYSYDERRGDPREGFPAGTAFASIPDTWCCPDCGVRDKVDFLVTHAE
jgi:rubredoxin